MPQSAPGMNASYGSRSAAGDRSSTLAKVMGLLALASVFTAAGAVAGLPLGRAGFFIGLIGAIVCLIVLGFVKDRLMRARSREMVGTLRVKTPSVYQTAKNMPSIGTVPSQASLSRPGR